MVTETKSLIYARGWGSFSCSSLNRGVCLRTTLGAVGCVRLSLKVITYQLYGPAQYNASSLTLAGDVRVRFINGRFSGTGH
jgi:hypothetical protein